MTNPQTLYTCIWLSTEFGLTTFLPGAMPATTAAMWRPWMMRAIRSHEEFLLEVSNLLRLRNCIISSQLHGAFIRLSQEMGFWAPNVTVPVQCIK